MSKASDFLRKLNEEVDMGQADSTLRKGTSKSFKYAVVDSSGETVSTYDDQGLAITAALKNDSYRVRRL